MASLLDIYNAAAVALGRDPTFSDPARVASQNSMGQAFAKALPILLPAAVAAYPWNFACKRQVIPVLETPPPFGWVTAYETPADLLRVRDINFVANCPREKFAREGALIYANTAGPANLRYIAAIFDPALFDAEFVEYAGKRLGAVCAFKVTGAASREGELNDIADKMLVRARGSDAQEAEEPDDDPDGEWLTYRSRFA